MAIVYQHRRRDTNEVFYIGIGKNESRAYKINNRNKHWIHIADKIGWDVDILIEGISWEDACKIEKGMIADYGRKDLGTGQLVNMTDGGDGTVGYIPTEEAKQKNREWHQNKKLTEDHKKNIGIAGIGRFQSQQKRDKLKKANEGKITTPETSGKISSTLIKLWSTEEYRSNIKRNTGKKYMNKDGVEKIVDSELLNSYIEEGWILGRDKNTIKKIKETKNK
jgi:hypothetical protein